MNAYERLRAALGHKPVDALPIILQGVDPYAQTRDRRSVDWNEVFARTQAVGDVCSFCGACAAPREDGVSAEQTVRELPNGEREIETIWTTPAGVLRQKHRDQIFTGAIMEHAVKDEEDLPAATALLSREMIVNQGATVESYNRTLREGNVLPLLLLAEPIDRVVSLMGAETFSILLAEEPEEIEALVEASTRPLLRTLQDTLDTGIRPAIWTFGSEWLTPPYTGPETFRRLALPCLHEIVRIAHAHDCPVLAHCHGSLSGVLDCFLEAEVDGIHPVEAPPQGDMTPEAFRERTQGRICFVGNLQLDDVLRASADEIEAKVEALLVCYHDWREGGFILGISGSPTSRDISATAAANYLRLLEIKERLSM